MVAPPHWLSTFANSVASCIHSHEILSPLGCHFQFVDNIWEVTIFASHTEIVGGANDGQISQSCFNVDMKEVIEQFSYIDTISWQTQSLGPDDELGCHLSVEGLCEEKQVWLRITALAPAQFGAGRQALVNQKKLEDLW